MNACHRGGQKHLILYFDMCVKERDIKIFSQIFCIRVIERAIKLFHSIFHMRVIELNIKKTIIFYILYTCHRARYKAFNFISCLRVIKLDQNYILFTCHRARYINI